MSQARVAHRNYLPAGAAAFLLIGSFAVYNNFIVDRYVVNLRIALARSASASTKEDFQEIRKLIKVNLARTITDKNSRVKEAAMLETADNLIGEAIKNGTYNKEDLRLALESLVGGSEKERGALLTAFDRINSQVYRPVYALKPAGGDEGLKKDILKTKDAQLLQEKYYQLGTSYIALGRLTEAAEAFRNASAAAPESKLGRKARFNLGWALKESGDMKGAYNVFDGLAKDEGVTPLSASCLYQVADIYYKTGRFDQANQVYAALKENYPQYWNLQLAAIINNYLPKGREEGDVSLSGKPQEQLPKVDLGVLGLKEPEEAELSAKAGLRRMEGYSLLSSRKFKEALQAFSRALEDAPNDQHSIMGKALAYVGLEDMKEASKTLKEVKIEGSTDLTLLTNYLFVSINTGELSYAASLGDRAVQDGNVRKGSLLFNLAYIYILKEKAKVAQSLLNRIININEKDLSAWNALGCAYWVEQKFPDSIKTFQRVIQIDPADYRGYFNLGMVYLMLKNYADAEECFKKVVAIYENNPLLSKTDPVFLKARSVLADLESNI
jgi:tetratricopeptide (TPR) repeat protein